NPQPNMPCILSKGSNRFISLQFKKHSKLSCLIFGIGDVNVVFGFLFIIPLSNNLPYFHMSLCKCAQPNILLGFCAAGKTTGSVNTFNVLEHATKTKPLSLISALSVSPMDTT